MEKVCYNHIIYVQKIQNNKAKYRLLNAGRRGFGRKINIYAAVLPAAESLWTEKETGDYYEIYQKDYGFYAYNCIFDRSYAGI